jgi:hypothetical protein
MDRLRARPTRTRARVRLVAALASGLAGLASCATSSSTSGGPRGAAGPVTWEVVDIGLLSSIDNLRFRWSYAVVLRNTGSVFVDLKQVETSYLALGTGDVIGGTPTMEPFVHSVAPNAELRVPEVDDWGWVSPSAPAFGGAATLEAITAVRRYVGTDATGSPVAIPVRLQLHRGVGKRSSPPRAPASLPAPERLRAPDLPHVSGQWRGSHRPSGGVFDIPLELTVSPDGMFEGGVNDPVTSPFGGHVRIVDGWVHLSAGSDSGRLGLYYVGAKHVLAGTVSGPREGGQTASYAVYLERVLPAGAAPPPRAP